MTPIFIPLWFNIQNSFYYVNNKYGLTDKDERPGVLFTQKDVDLYNWLVENVGPALTPLDDLPITGDGWKISNGNNTNQPAGVYIDDELLAVQLKCSGVLDDRPEDPMIKMVKDMQVAMMNVKNGGSFFYNRQLEPFSTSFGKNQGPR
jgi:hypothetical protein